MARANVLKFNPNLTLLRGGKPEAKKAPVLVPTSSDQIDHYIDEFLKVKRTKKEWTQDFYRKGLKRYREFPGATFPPTVECLNEFILHLQASPGRRGKAVNPTTIHAYLRAIETWCNWLVRQNILAENPVEWADAPNKPKRKTPRAPAADVVRELTQALESQAEKVLGYKKDLKHWRLIRDLCFLSLTTDTGMRVGEIERIWLENIDLDRKKIYIPEAKDDEERDVIFGVKARGDLKLWIKTREGLDLPDEEELPLFVSFHRGTWQPFTQGGIRQMLARRAEELGIKYYSPHAFRHFFAGQALHNGGDLEFVRNQLGHASLTTTSIYTRMHLEELMEAHAKSSPADNL